MSTGIDRFASLILLWSTGWICHPLIPCYHFKYQAKHLQVASGVYITFRELLIVITFPLKSSWIQEYIFCCISLHKSVILPVNHLCCFSLNILQYISNLLIMRFPGHGAVFQTKPFSLFRDGVCLFAHWYTVSTYKVLMLPDHIWIHDSCALYYNACGNPSISLNRSKLDI